jgi:hypothetical protein
MTQLSFDPRRCAIAFVTTPGPAFMPDLIARF